MSVSRDDQDYLASSQLSEVKPFGDLPRKHLSKLRLAFLIFSITHIDAGM
jgi:hypothetical protein